MEISRREAVIGLLALPGALSTLAEAEKSQPILGPTVFKWEDMKPVKTATGEVRSLCKAPTATVNQLEMHVSTLNPGLASHPPHRHVNEELIILREGEKAALVHHRSLLRIGLPRDMKISLARQF